MLHAQMSTVGSFHWYLVVRFELECDGGLMFLVEQFGSNKLFKRCVSDID